MAMLRTLPFVLTLAALSTQQSQANYFLQLHEDPDATSGEESAGEAPDAPAADAHMNPNLGKGQLPEHDIDDPQGGGSNASPGHDQIKQANDAASDPEAVPDFGLGFLQVREDPEASSGEASAGEEAAEPSADAQMNPNLGKGQLPEHDIDDPQGGGSNASPGHDQIKQANDAASDPEAVPDFGLGFLQVREDPDATAGEESVGEEAAEPSADAHMNPNLGKGQLSEHDIDDPQGGGSNASPGHDQIKQANDAASDPEATPDFGLGLLDVREEPKPTTGEDSVSEKPAEPAADAHMDPNLGKGQLPEHDIDDPQGGGSNSSPGHDQIKQANDAASDPEAIPDFGLGR